MARHVRVHDLDEARRALERASVDGCEPVLVSAPGSAAFAGVGFWHAVEQALDRTVVIDCGDDAGAVMAALRAGCRDLLFSGPEEIATKLDDMGRQMGARLRRGLDDA